MAINEKKCQIINDTQKKYSMNNCIIHTALITGIGSGLGLMIANHLAKLGIKVAGSVRKKPLLMNYHKDIKIFHSEVTDEASIKDLFIKTYEVIGIPDLIIANAGFSESAPIEKTTLSLWNKIININMTGTFLTFKEALKLMDYKKPGRLIAISSTAGLKGYQYVSAYCAAKHGVIGLVKSLAKELSNSPITVNAICPGFMITPMLEKTIKNIMKKTSMNLEQAYSTLQKMNPQNRFIHPKEVIETIIWICAKYSCSITGQSFSISGGEI